MLFLGLQSDLSWEVKSCFKVDLDFALFVLLLLYVLFMLQNETSIETDIFAISVAPVY